MSRVEDVLYADTLTKNPSLAAQSYRNRPKESSPSNIGDDVDHWNSAETPNSMTLSDFMGWNLDHGAIDHMKKMNNMMCEMDNCLKEENDKHKSKIVNIVTTKKMSYLERLENLSGLRSPTARH